MSWIDIIVYYNIDISSYYSFILSYVDMANNNKPFHDYDKEMKYQEQFLKEQDTEMGVSKNALEKWGNSFYNKLVLTALLWWWVVAGVVGIEYFLSHKDENKSSSKHQLIKAPALLRDTLQSQNAPYIYTAQDSLELEHALHPDSLLREEYDANDH